MKWINQYLKKCFEDLVESLTVFSEKWCKVAKCYLKKCFEDLVESLTIFSENWCKVAKCFSIFVRLRHFTGISVNLIELICSLSPLKTSEHRRLLVFSGKNKVICLISVRFQIEFRNSPRCVCLEKYCANFSNKVQNIKTIIRDGLQISFIILSQIMRIS